MTFDALHLDFPVPSRADDQAVGVVGVTFVDLYRQGSSRVTRVQAHHRQLEGAELVHQPGGQRTALQPNPLQRRGAGRKRLRDRPGRGCTAPAPGHEPSLIDDAHRGLGLRHIESSKNGHGSSPLRFDAIESLPQSARRYPDAHELIPMALVPRGRFLVCQDERAESVEDLSANGRPELGPHVPRQSRRYCGAHRRLFDRR